VAVDRYGGACRAEHSRAQARGRSGGWVVSLGFQSVRSGGRRVVLPLCAWACCATRPVSGPGASVWGWVSMLNETTRKVVLDEIQNEGCDGWVGGRDGV
jgi:hypothetical protein